MKRIDIPAVSIYALIRRNGRVLLTQDRYRSGWKLPGGGVGRDELLIDALKREIREEVGLGIQVRALVVISNWVKKGTGQSRIRMYFLADVRGGKLSLGDGEVARARWFSRPELGRLKRRDFLLPQHYFEAVTRYLEGWGTPAVSARASGSRRVDFILGTKGETDA